MKNREDEISSEGVLALIYLPNFRGRETLWEDNSKWTKPGLGRSQTNKARKGRILVSQKRKLLISRIWHRSPIGRRQMTQNHFSVSSNLTGATICAYRITVSISDFQSDGVVSITTRRSKPPIGVLAWILLNKLPEDGKRLKRLTHNRKENEAQISKK